MDHEAQFVETFRQEAYELLHKMEGILLDMEENPDDRDSIHRLFRAIHTIKGSGGMFGFDDVAKFAHHAENLLDEVREGAVPVTVELVELILLVKDRIKGMLDASDSGKDRDMALSQKIVARLHEMLPKKKEKTSLSSEAGPEVNENELIYRIRFGPDPFMMRSGMNPLLILDELRELGQCEIIAHRDNIPVLEKLETDEIYVFWDIILVTTADERDVKDVFIFVEDGSNINIQITESEDGKDEEPPMRLGDILVDRGDVSLKNINRILQKQKRVGELLVESGEVSKEDVESALMEQRFLKERKFVSQDESVRISSDKLDKMINLVGEMVVTQAHLSHLADENDNSVFNIPVKQLDRLIGDLREFALDMRMLPVGILFGRFRRLVRDLSAELGKEIDLVLEGSETELDKTILEKLHDPLIHLIRNSIDHGIKSPEEMEEHGKSRKGTINLRAAHRGARMNITVADDGMGIDTERVRSMAVEKGLISESHSLSEKEIHELIFAPGFTTAREVSDVSGRGVGMDVVKQVINSLGGTIKIQSIPGRGTSFNLELPLTLAIIEGLHVTIGQRHFIIPVSQVEMCEEVNLSSRDKRETRNMIDFKGEVIPFIRLREFFQIPGHSLPYEHMAAIQVGQYRLGLVVDEILGNIQTVIKPLDPLYRRAEGVSGGTIMGDGKVGLIVDLQEIISAVKKENEYGAK